MGYKALAKCFAVSPRDKNEITDHKWVGFNFLKNTVIGHKTISHKIYHWEKTFDKKLESGIGNPSTKLFQIISKMSETYGISYLW